MVDNQQLAKPGGGNPPVALPLIKVEQEVEILRKENARLIRMLKIADRRSETLDSDLRRAQGITDEF